MELRIVLTKKQCSKIKTSKDLNDIYAYFERGGSSNTYLFDTTEQEQERIDALVNDINYKGGVYDSKNVDRILGLKYEYGKARARAKAINFQIECSKRNMSYSECLDYDIYFTKLGKRYGLLREFRENGII